jgi:hypothetical protein
MASGSSPDTNPSCPCRKSSLAPVRARLRLIQRGNRHGFVCELCDVDERAADKSEALCAKKAYAPSAAHSLGLEGSAA